jgi:DHA1 family multidrug/chloramphenicol efflux transport protein-like MFS transporter
MYLPALPEMMHDLKISATHAQLTVTMWFLGSASMPLIMGAIADRFGRRPTLLVGGILYVISTVMCAIAIDETTLLVPRIIQGAMISSMMVAGYAVIHELYEHKEAIRFLAIMGGISVLAPALGPLLGAIVLLFADWRWIFWMIALYSSVMLACLYQYMPETLEADTKQSLHPGKVFAKYWQVFANRNFILLMATLGCTFAGFISWITAAPLLVIESMKYSVISFGWMQAAVFAAYIYGSHLVNKLLQYRDATQLVNLGLLVSLVAGLFISFFAYYMPDKFYLFLIAIIIYSFGSALCFAPLNRMIIETSDQPMGIRVALFTAGLMGCGVLGSGIASVVYNGTSFSLGVIITVGIVLAFILQCIYRHLRTKHAKST